MYGLEKLVTNAVMSSESMRLTSLDTRLFIRMLVQANDIETTKGSHYWFVVANNMILHIGLLTIDTCICPKEYTILKREK